MSVSAEKRLNGFHIFMIILYIISFAFLAYYFYHGWDYYSTPFSERPRHPEYSMLKPGGLTGHGFGVIGSAMMLIMLLYSLRKRTHIFSKAGTLPAWLDIHIYLGIIGPLLIILHSTFKVHGLVAVSFYSMAAVALSGIFGRYLYLQIPRNIQGYEISLNELKAMDSKLSRDLKEQYKFTDDMINRLEHLSGGTNIESRNTWVFLFSLLWHDIKKKSELEKFIKDNTLFDQFSAGQIRTLLKFIRQKAVLHQRIQILTRIQHLFHYWHVIHKPFAIIMIIIMFIHIAVAITFGYTWVF